MTDNLTKEFLTAYEAILCFLGNHSNHTHLSDEE